MANAIETSCKTAVKEAFSRAFAGAQAPAAYQTLSHSVLAIIDEHSDAQQRQSRDALKAQQVSHEMKMAHARTAARVTLEARTAEMEASFHRRVEEEVRNSTGAAQLEDAHRQLELVGAELSKARAKCAHLEQALQTSQQLHRVSELQRERTEHELRNEHTRAEELLADMISCAQIAADTLSELISGSERGGERGSRKGSSGGSSSAGALLADLRNRRNERDDEKEDDDEKEEDDESPLPSPPFPAPPAQLEPEIARLADAARKRHSELWQVNKQLERAAPTLADMASGDAAGTVAGGKRAPQRARWERLTMLEKLGEVMGELLDARDTPLRVLRRRVQELEERLEESETARRQAESEGRELRASIGVLSDEHSRAQAALKAAQHESTELRGELHGDGPNSAEARQRLEAELSNWRGRATTAMDTSERLAAEMARLREDVTRDIARHEKESAEANTALARANAELERLREDVLTLNGEKAGASAAAAAAISARSQLDARCRTLEASLAHMGSELSRATSTVGLLQDQLDEDQEAAQTRIKEVRDEARQHREMLVRDALRSLQQLRSHLVAALGGGLCHAFSEASRRGGDPQVSSHPTAQGGSINGQKLAWRPADRRWGMKREGYETIDVRTRIHVPRPMPSKGGTPIRAPSRGAMGARTDAGASTRTVLMHRTPHARGTRSAPTLHSSTSSMITLLREPNLFSPASASYQGLPQWRSSASTGSLLPTQAHHQEEPPTPPPRPVASSTNDPELRDAEGEGEVLHSSSTSAPRSRPAQIESVTPDPRSVDEKRPAELQRLLEDRRAAASSAGGSSFP